MRAVTAIAMAAAFVAGGSLGAFALLISSRTATDGAAPPSHHGAAPPSRHGAAPPSRPVWAEVQWPFPADQWGRGKAFHCKAADCGAEIRLYLRAKLGFCDCKTGVADDGDLDRMSDFDLVGGEVLPLGAGRPITVAWMKGRSRAYTLAARTPPGRTALSVVFNDRCDMVAATAVLPHDRPETIEPAVIDFLNGSTVLRWAETTLGL